MNYLKAVDEIIYLLSERNEELVIGQIKSAQMMGGTGGEVLSIIGSLLKSHEIRSPEIFSAISKPVYELYGYAEEVGLKLHANFDLLDELSK